MKEAFFVITCVVAGLALLYGLYRAVLIPLEFSRYLKSPYYQDLKLRYRQDITKKPVYRLYCAMVRDKLPIAYHCHDDREYFVRDGQVLLFWHQPMYRILQGEQSWFCQIHYRNDSLVDLERYLAGDQAHLKGEHRKLPAKYLLFNQDLQDTIGAETAKDCPYFVCIDDPRELA